MKAAGGFGSRWMTDLINNIVKEGCIPDDWKKSILVPVYKGKGDPLVCGSYRAIKLLEQPMKVLERVLEKRIRCQVSIDNMQFGFMPGKGTTDADDVMVDVETYECVKSVCYLGDTLDGDGGADLAATARIRNGWMKFRELL